MALTSGTRLGVYQILAPIGAGGMGHLAHAAFAKLGDDLVRPYRAANHRRHPGRATTLMAKTGGRLGRVSTGT